MVRMIITFNQNPKCQIVLMFDLSVTGGWKGNSWYCGLQFTPGIRSASLYIQTRMTTYISNKTQKSWIDYKRTKRVLELISSVHKI